MVYKSFILTKTENIDKLSVHYYDPNVVSFIDNVKKNGVKLSDLVVENGIISGPMGFNLHTYDYVPENFPNRVKLLQISNIDEFGEIINTSRDKYISSEKHKELKSSQVKKGDLIVAKTGELGRIALFDKNFKANLNQALGIIRLKDKYNNIRIIPRYIHIFLNSIYAYTQFMWFGGYRSGQSGLSLKEISNIYIILPNEKEQEHIIKTVDTKRKQASVHFQNYLNFSRESKLYPLKELNIKLPDESKNVFIYNKEIINRLDAPYNSDFLFELKVNIKKTNYKKLSELIVKAKNKFEYDSYYRIIDLDDIDENISEIVSFKEISVLNSTKTMFKADNLLISKLGSEKGKIILIDEQYEDFIGSGELIPYVLKSNVGISMKYIFYLLRSPLLSKQIEYSLSGSSRMRINDNLIKNLLIPYIDNKVEKKIIQEVSKLIEKAKNEYSEYLKKKKEIFNEMKQHIDDKIKADNTVYS